MNERKIQISEELVTCESDGKDPNSDLVPYAGPVALRIEALMQVNEALERRIIELETVATDQRFEALSKRIEALESQPTPNAKVQAGDMSIDTRPGLTVQDVVDLIWAAK